MPTEAEADAVWHTMLLTFGISFPERSFAVADPTISNTVPLDIRNSLSTCCFRHHRKTFFYNPGFRPS